MDKDTIYEILDRAYFTDHPDEEEVLKLLPDLLKEVQHFVDIGASLGQFTLHASRILKGGRIDSFEADPVRAERLKENCAKWSEASGNDISAHFAAVARTSGTLTFHSTQSNVSGGLFPTSLSHLDDEARANVCWTEVSVPATSLDDFYGSTPPSSSKWILKEPKGRRCRARSGCWHDGRHDG